MVFFSKNTSQLAHSRRLGLLVALLLLVSTVAVLHREVLWQGQVYHMDDAADGYYPGRVAHLRALSEGTLPTWEPHALGGWPLLADPYYGYFYPPNLVFYLPGLLGPRPLLPSGRPDYSHRIAFGLGLSVALHTVFAGLTMYLYLRRKQSFAGALFGALSYALSSFFVVRIRHVIFVQVMAWVPLLLLAIDGYLDSHRPPPPTLRTQLPAQRRRFLALASLATGMIFLCGAHSLLHFLALFVGIYAIAQLVQVLLLQPSSQRARVFFRALGGLGLAALGGLGIGAAALAPTLAALPHTTRALGTSYAFASSYAWPSLRFLSLLFLPNELGVGEWRGTPFLGPWNHWELAGYYPGFLAILLCLPGAWVGLRSPVSASSVPSPGEVHPPRDGIVRWALLGLALLGPLIALGASGPVHPLLFRWLPLYAALRCPARGLVLSLLACPILASYAVSHWFATPLALPQPPPSPARLRRLLHALLPVGLLLAVILLADRALHLPIGPPSVALFRRQALLHAALVGTGFLWLLSLRGLLRTLPTLLGLALALWVAVDALHIDRGYIQSKPRTYVAGTERFSAVDWLLQNDAQLAASPAALRGATPYRISPDPSGPFRLLAAGQTLGLEFASGYTSVQVWRMAHLLYILRHHTPYPHPTLQHDLAAGALWDHRSPLVDVLNVRFALAKSPPSPSWQEVYRPPSLPDGSPAALHEPAWNAALRVYENPHVLPRAHVVYAATLAASPRDEARLVADPSYDPHAQVVLGQPSTLSLPTGALPPPLPPSLSTPDLRLLSPPPPPTPAVVRYLSRSHVVIDALAHKPGVLVLADTYFPGWTATVDGVPAPIYPAHLALRGILLPTGSHRVELRYAAPAVTAGLLISLACAALLGVVLALSRSRS